MPGQLRCFQMIVASAFRRFLEHRSGEIDPVERACIRAQERRRESGAATRIQHIERGLAASEKPRKRLRDELRRLISQPGQMAIEARREGIEMRPHEVVGSPIGNVLSGAGGEQMSRDRVLRLVHQPPPNHLGSFREASLMRQVRGEAVVGAPLVRFERDRLAVGRGRFFKAVQLEERIPQIVIRVGMRWIQVDRPAAGFLRFREQVQDAKDRREVVVGVRGIGTKRDDPLVLLPRFLEAAQFLVDVAEIVVRGRVLGGELQ